MGVILSRFDIHLGTRMHQYDNNRIPIHHKCRNCGEKCDSSAGCVNANYTRTGTAEQPLVVRCVVPREKARWSSSFNYHPVEFTSQKVKTSTKEYIDRDPRLDRTVEIPWNTDDVICDRRSYHGIYKIVEGVPQNPCGRTGITGRGHLGRRRSSS
jgi:hypothetical protein